MTAREWEELKALSRREFIGEDRADVSRQRAAVGVMSSNARLGSFDPTSLLPNPPERREQTLEEECAALEAYSKKINHKWQPHSEHSPPS